MSTDSDNRRVPETLPTGLALFPKGTAPAKRRRRLIFVSIYLVAAAMLVWPIFPLFSGIQPLILGLPLSFAWIILALAIMFVALLWLFRVDDHDDRSET